METVQLLDLCGTKNSIDILIINLTKYLFKWQAKSM